MKQSHKLVVGDFNYKHINWNTWSTSRNDSSNEQLFIDTIQDIYWYQHISEPTRYREGEDPSLLDLVFTNEEAMIQHIQHQSPLGKSDHSILVIDFLIKQATSFKPRTVYSYDKANYEKRALEQANVLHSNSEFELEVVKRQGCIEEIFWRFPGISEKILGNKFIKMFRYPLNFIP